MVGPLLREAALPYEAALAKLRVLQSAVSTLPVREAAALLQQQPAPVSQLLFRSRRADSGRARAAGENDLVALLRAAPLKQLLALLAALGHPLPVADMT